MTSAKNTPETDERLIPLLLLSAGLILAWYPHIARIPLWLALLFPGAMVLRLASAFMGWPLPRGVWLTLPTALSAAGIVYTVRPFFGGPGALSLFTAMLALKLFETGTRRDRIILVLAGFVLIATRFIYGETPATGLWMVGLTVLFTCLLAGYAEGAEKRRTFENVKTAVVIVLQGIPLAVVLFIAFPRTGMPLFVFGGGKGATTGLSGEMSPGSISALAVSDALVFRAEFDGMAPPATELYWRGPVFDSFDGRTWRSSGKKNNPPENLRNYKRMLGMTIIPIAETVRYITPLDLPAIPGAGLKLMGDRTAEPKEGMASITEGTGFEFRSAISAVTGPPDEETRGRNLALPGDTSPRVLNLGRSFGPPGPEAAARALAFFREGEFVYTLNPPLLGDDHVDEFLFGTKKGFCEHYASALTVLLRAAGVPARVVTGYMGGEYNPYAENYMVEERHAHAWVEAWLTGGGWTRLDPTAAVSPARLTNAINYENSLMAGQVGYDQPPVEGAINLRYAVHSLRFLWNDWVVGFGPARQRRLFGALGMGRLEGAAMLLAGVLFLPLFYTVARTGVKYIRKRRGADPLEKGWGAFNRKMARAGFEKRGDEPPLAYGSRLSRAMPEDAKKLLSITRKYTRLKYGRTKSVNDVAEFVDEVERLTPGARGREK